MDVENSDVHVGKDLTFKSLFHDHPTFPDFIPIQQTSLWKRFADRSVNPESPPNLGLATAHAAAATTAQQKP